MRLGLGGSLVVVAAVFAGLCQGRHDGGGHPETRAGNDSNVFSGVLPILPSCSRDCYTTGLDGLDCPDKACACTDKGFRANFRACVIDACNRADALATKNMTDMACHRPRRDRSVGYTVMSIVLGYVTCVVIGLRMLFKWRRRRIGVDDWIIVSSLTVGIPCTALNVQGLARHGIGRDTWTLQTQTVVDFVFYFFVLEVFYVAMMAMVRVAMCFFYLSLFPGTRIRQVLRVTASVNVLIGIASVLTAILQCSLVSYYWATFVEPGTGSCIDIQVLAWVHGGLNIAMNLWLIGIPLSRVPGLELHWKKKIGVTIMFLTGAIDTVVSALRLHSLLYFAHTWNPTWDHENVAWCSTIEINIGLICTCLPTLRLILTSMAPRVFGSGRGSSRDTPAHTASRGIILQKQVRISSIEGSLGTEAVSQTRHEPWEAASEEPGSRPQSAAYSGPHPQW